MTGRSSIVTLRTVALLEGAKGAVALLAASGLALHREVAAVVHLLAEHLHLNPGRDLPNAFYEALKADAAAHLKLIAGGILVYAVIRFVEAVGLWRERRWAEWLGALSAAVYLPFELLQFARHPGLLSAGFVVFTSFLVIFLGMQLVVARQRP